MATSPYLPYPYSPEPGPTNWTVVIMLFAGILIVFVFITIFFFIPDYIRGYLHDLTQERIDNLEKNAVSYGCSSDIYNCSNFSTQAGAQDVFNWCVSVGTGDVHQLDKDGNGRACETLP